MIGRTQRPSPRSLNVYHCVSKLPETGGSGQAETIWKIFLNCIILPCDLATDTRVSLQQGYSHDHIRLKLSDRPEKGL